MNVELENRIEKLIANFEHYVSAFDRDPPFSDDQLRAHLESVRIRADLGSASLAATDKDFLESLWLTLKAWRMDMRAARLVPLDVFVSTFLQSAPAISALEDCQLDDTSLDIGRVVEGLWDVIEDLRISTSRAKLVSCTKALHHLLPDLVVPMDRQFTGTFFGLNNNDWQNRQKRTFQFAVGCFARIARATDPSRFVGGGWRTSRTKILDNALVAFCREHAVDDASLKRRLKELGIWDQIVTEIRRRDEKGS